MPKHSIYQPGDQIGRLTLLRETDNRYYGQRMWLCRCVCGNEREVGAGLLQRGMVRSCGCLKSEHTSWRSTTHGLSKHPAYGTWNDMLQRCYNPKRPHYEHWGGRGIEVCSRWQGVDGLANFIADMWPKPASRHSLDRIDNEGHYTPANCHWATWSEQARNRRRVPNTRVPPLVA